jgi:hypothetical protein
MKSPSFQFYASDFLASTVSLSVKDVGAYIRLLCYQWASGKIPDAPKDIARIAGCKVSPAVLAKFQDGKNERLEQERLKQEQWREKCAIGGRHSAESRKGSSTNLPRVVPRALELNLNTPSPSPSPKNTLRPPDGERGATIPKAPKKHARNPLLDALVACDGSNPEQVTGSAWAAAAKALKEIKEVAPEVTPEEIAARARVYKALMPNVSIGPSALAKHWARCQPGRKQAELKPIEEPFDWRNWINENSPDTPYARGGEKEGAQWSELDRSYQTYLVEQIGRLGHRGAA